MGKRIYAVSRHDMVTDDTVLQLQSAIGHRGDEDVAVVPVGPLRLLLREWANLSTDTDQPDAFALPGML